MLPSDEPIEFECPTCEYAIRAVAGTGQVKCPQCSQLVAVPGSTITAVPAEDDGDALPSLADLEYSALPEISTVEDESPAKSEDSPLPRSETSGPNNPPETAAVDLASLVDNALNRAGESSPPDDPNATIKLDDSDFYQNDDVFGIKCHVCDTRIHVRPDQVGGTVECPDCFTVIEVEAAIKKKEKIWGRGGKTAPEERMNESVKRQDPTRPNPTTQDNSVGPIKIGASGGGAAALDDPAIEDSSGADVGELKLSDPVELPDVEPVIGLDPVTEDLLKPAPLLEPTVDRVPDVGNSEVISVDDPIEISPIDTVPATTGNVSQPEATRSSSTASNQSPRTRPNAAEPAKATDRTTSSPSGQAEASKPLSRAERLAQAKMRREREEEREGFEGTFVVDEEEQDFPAFEHGSLFSATISMLTTPGVLWRVAIALTLMLIGALGKEAFYPEGLTHEDFDGFVDRATRGLTGIVFGALPYAAGLFVLWFVAGYIFRDAALGKRRVEKWSFAGATELLSTFLLFGFSYFLAGILGLFFQPIVLPLRMLIGPLFLTAAFFNRSAWGVVAVDIFSNFRRISGQWMNLYVWMVSLAGIGLLAGVLFRVRRSCEAYWLDAGLSIVGVLITVLITLVFAAVVGWHTGLIIKDLQEE